MQWESICPNGSYKIRVEVANCLSDLNLAFHCKSYYCIFLFLLEPVGLDPPMVVSIGPRSVNLTWQAPLISNGYVSAYKIYINGQSTLTVSTYYNYNYNLILAFKFSLISYSC